MMIMVLAGAAGAAVLAAVRALRVRADREEELRKSLAEAVVHDLKNPMTSIMGCLTCVLNDSPDRETQAKLLRLALHSCRAQLELLDTLIDAGRLESGSLEPQRAALDAEALLQRCRADVAAAAQNLGIRVGGTSKDLSPLEADGDLLKRVILYLLGDAIKHTPRGGEVSLDAESRRGALAVYVRDTGAEVSAEQASRFFDKHHRVQAAPRGRRGTGLGFYFCRLAVEAHGGRIALERLPGGARVKIVLPQPALPARRPAAGRRP